VVVGDDGTIERYRHLARELDVAGRALFLGRRTDVDRLHAAADVFALPSRFDAIANATLEALASGLPVVVSRQDGIAEIVEPAGCGIVVQDPRDAGEVARALTTLGDPGRREAMGRAARRAAEEISVERQMDRYVELFERVARQGAPR
jgi:UDP-glucose:(heptosyl)LPS alpha-1,3-glucosyltransferase